MWCNVFQHHYASSDEAHPDTNKSDRFIPSPVSELKDLKINTQIPKLIQRLPNSCAFRKDLQRNLRKPVNDLNSHRREKSKSASLTNLPTNVSTGKFSKRCAVSDSVCDALEKQLPEIEPIDPFNLTPSERHRLLESAKEERKNQKFIDNVSTTEVYQRQSQSTISVTPFVKLAYPDVHVGTYIHEKQTKLFDPDPYLMRYVFFLSLIWKSCLIIFINVLFMIHVFALSLLSHTFSREKTKIGIIIKFSVLFSYSCHPLLCFLIPLPALVNGTK